jgi:NADH-quinone oxidoreductase subunit H
MRAAAQLISYEVAMGLSLVGVLMTAGTLSLTGIVEAQSGMWYVVPQFVGFIVFTVAGFAETNRAPFDLPEAESELVAGFHTEYSSVKFALFFLSEYINMVTVSALATTLFLGGWMPPPIPYVSGLDSGVWPLVWFLLKVTLFIFGFIWLRGTLPRYRYDQFMALGWKRLVPAALGWVVLVATARTAVNNLSRDRLMTALVVGFVVVLIIAALPWGSDRDGKKTEEARV